MLCNFNIIKKGVWKLKIEIYINDILVEDGWQLPLK